MSPITNEIITQLKSMTLLDAAELVSQIEEAFGVDAKSPAGRIGVMPIVRSQSIPQNTQEQKNRPWKKNQPKNSEEQKKQWT